MKVSIVIPVYNEAAALAACLEAIAAQTVTPYEVIVVNNNSTDDTARVARSFGFVRLLEESKQGVVHARSRGFNAARGDVIGRIDADSLLPARWVAQVRAIFADPSVGAVSGAAHYYDFALDTVADAADAFFRARLASKLGQTNFLWGANMAVRRSAWQRVRSHLCSYGKMHEDFDLAIHLQQQGFKVTYAAGLLAGASSRRIDTGFVDYVRYTLMSPRTYARHGLSSRRHMYPVLAACWLAYVPGRLIYRSVDPITGDFSVSRLVAFAPPRVDPTTNVA